MYIEFDSRLLPLFALFTSLNAVMSVYEKFLVDTYDREIGTTIDFVKHYVRFITNEHQYLIYGGNVREYCVLQTETHMKDVKYSSKSSKSYHSFGIDTTRRLKKVLTHQTVGYFDIRQDGHGVIKERNFFKITNWNNGVGLITNKTDTRKMDEDDLEDEY